MELLFPLTLSDNGWSKIAEHLAVDAWHLCPVPERIPIQYMAMLSQMILQMVHASLYVSYWKEIKQA